MPRGVYDRKKAGQKKTAKKAAKKAKATKQVGRGRKAASAAPSGGSDDLATFSLLLQYQSVLQGSGDSAAFTASQKNIQRLEKLASDMVPLDNPPEGNGGEESEKASQAVTQDIEADAPVQAPAPTFTAANAQA